MMYAADKYDVVYRMKDSKKKLEVTLHPTTWAELLPRMPKKKRAGAASDYSFKVDEKEEGSRYGF